MRARALKLIDVHGFAIAACVYACALALMMSLVVLGKVHSVPYGVYEAAGQRWSASQELYETQTIDGFQYLPTSAWLFSLFARLGDPLGEWTWRVLSLTLYATGLWRVSKRLLPARAPACFLIATCLTIGPVGNNLGNGQANLLLAALSLHVVADLALRRWWRASITLALGLALKPLMIVIVLLVMGTYRPVRWRALVVIVAVFGLPWLWRDPSWLAHQYAVCFRKLSMCAAPDREFEDVRGLLSSVGVSLDNGEYLALRALAAVAVFAFAWFARAFVREPMSSVLIGALAVNYLMLFNPRTQTTSYVMLVAFVGVLAARCLLRGRARMAMWLIAIAVACNVAGHFAAWSIFWLKPLGACVFLVLLVREAIGCSQSSWRMIAPATSTTVIISSASMRTGASSWRRRWPTR